jgi:hypothetical protein
MKLRYTIASYLCVIIFFGFSTQVTWADEMQQVKSVIDLLKEKQVLSKPLTLKGQTKSYDTWEVVASTDGTLELVMGTFMDYGNSWMKGNQWCGKFDVASDGSTSCFTINHLEENKYVLEEFNGDQSSKVTITFAGE